MSETTLNLRPEVTSPGGTESASRPKRILLVEGDGFTRIVLLLQLRLAGFLVDFTSNGYLGLGKLRTCRPDVLLLELKLCGLSGMDLIKAARAEPAFGNKPIYVFTHADRMHRNIRKELVLLVTKVFDKSTMTREDLVQTFSSMFLKRQRAKELPAAKAPAKLPPEIIKQVISPQEIEEIVAGVREQSEVLATQTESRPAAGQELLSRVCSLKSCADAAQLPNLARQAKALQNFLNQLCTRTQKYTEANLRTVARAVEVMGRMSFKTTPKEQGLARFSVVSVDEAPRSSEATAKALGEAGFNAVCFEDARLAREHLASNSTELIITNLALPEAHGLSLADIRQLPLHAETPVIFGPDSPTFSPNGEELPTSAPRLDVDPLLLAEVVVKALNEIQSPEQQSVTGTPPVNKPSANPQQPLAQLSAESDLLGEDDFNLFSKAPSHPLSIDESIPEEPFLRVEPAAPAPDREAEFLIRLPANSVDASQNDERPLEALPPAPLFAQMTEAPQPEGGEDQTATAKWLEAASGEASQSIPASTSESAIEVNTAAQAEEYAAAAPNYGEVMNHQLEATSVEYLQQAESLRRQQIPREDLAARVCAAEMALYHAKAEAERKGQTIEALQAQLAETMAQRAEQDQTSAVQSEAEQKALAHCAELEQEVASLRQVVEGFNGGFGEQQEAAAETDQRVLELEERLNQSATELEKQRTEQQQAEAELRRQLEAAQVASQPVEAARQQAEDRCAQVEKELSTLRQAHDELANKLAQKVNTVPGQTTGGEAGAPESELEQQVRQGVAALARATAELAKERGERQRSQQRAAELNSRLQALHDDLRRTLQAQHEDLARISSLEEEHRQTALALEQRTADVEQHKAEHFLTEEQLQKQKEANAQLRKDLAFFEEASKKFGGGRQELLERLEASLNTARENETRLQRETVERQRLGENLEDAKRDLQNQARKCENLQKELQAAQEALQDREAKLQKEVGERQKLNDALRSVKGNAQDRSERDLELTKLQSSLEEEQVERKRQETQLARIRQKAIDSAHSARALRTNMRRQIREPVDNLVQSTRSLLELELGDEQKQLAEAVLQDVLLVQTRLREPDLAHSESVGPGEPNTAS